MSVISTLVVNFGENAATVSGSIVAEWDGSLNVDNNGDEKLQFIPGDQAYLLVHSDSTVKIEGVKVTSGGVNTVGSVGLLRQQEIGWSGVDDVQALAYLPAGKISYDWKGRVGTGVAVDGKEISFAGGFPCLAVVSFKVLFTRYLIQTPNVTLAKDETYPLRAYIYFSEVVS